MAGRQVGNHHSQGQPKHNNQNGLPVLALKGGSGQTANEAKTGQSRPQAWGTHLSPSFARRIVACAL